MPRIRYVRCPKCLKAIRHRFVCDTLRSTLREQWAAMPAPVRRLRGRFVSQYWHLYDSAHSRCNDYPEQHNRCGTCAPCQEAKLEKQAYLMTYHCKQEVKPKPEGSCHYPSCLAPAKAKRKHCEVHLQAASQRMAHKRAALKAVSHA